MFEINHNNNKNCLENYDRRNIIVICILVVYAPAEGTHKSVWQNQTADSASQ